MRIIALTDIHGSYQKVNAILSRETGYEVILIGGDLTTHGSPKEAEEAIHLFRRYAKPILAVAGNMDPPELDDLFSASGISINARGVIIGEVGFFGTSGSPFTPMNTPYEISEDEIGRRAEAGWNDVLAARWKIFVPHAPPFNTKLDKIFLGKHVGSTAVRRFIEQHQPDAVVCGHIHEARGLDSIGETKMVNCGPAGRGYYSVIEVSNSISVEARG